MRVDRPGAKHRARLWERREIERWEGLAWRESLALAVVRVVGDVVDEVFAVRKSLGEELAVVVHVNSVEYRLDLLGRKLRRRRELIDDPVGTSTAPDGARTRRFGAHRARRAHVRIVPSCGVAPAHRRGRVEVRGVPLVHDERPVGAEGFLAARPR